mmetsp:Transcript_439/g.493  ORF Transcript_439/g.493 Transcript_439/m.493 type:complete len:186 (+) Transcript_439:455-1012(+)
MILIELSNAPAAARAWAKKKVKARSKTRSRSNSSRTNRPKPVPVSSGSLHLEVIKDATAATAAAGTTTATAITKNPTAALVLWGLHFGLNVAWVPIFFGLQRLRLGLIVSCILVATLLFIIPVFYLIDPLAAYLLIPYGIWLSFATFALNVAVCRLNPTENGYNNAMFQAQLKKLQDTAATYAGV